MNKNCFKKGAIIAFSFFALSVSASNNSRKTNEVSSDLRAVRTVHQPASFARELEVNKLPESDSFYNDIASKERALSEIIDKSIADKFELVFNDQYQGYLDILSSVINDN